MPRLSAKVLSALQPGVICRDDSVRGLFAECTAGGGVSLKLQADLRAEGRRQSIRITLGRWPALALDDARARALALLAEVRAGRDPRAAPAPDGAGAWTVGRAFERYVEDLAKRPGSELSQRDMRARLARYLEDWRALPLASLTKELCEARQAQVAASIRSAARQRNATGARTANAVIRDLGAVWEFASDYTPLGPGPNPTRRVKMIGEIREHHEIPVSELAQWWTTIGKLRNPLRVAMHRLGLLSGLRPGNLVAIERAWIGDRRIDFPAHAMKGRKAFTLPLSLQMGWLVADAIKVGDVLERGSPYLFPSRNAKGEPAPTRVVRESTAALKDRTGHALRHTWKTCARLARVPESTIEILMAHRLGGVRDTYGSLEDQIDMLREAQAQVSAWILARVSAGR